MEDIKRNGSGYYDPTMYQAIKNCVGGVKKMKVYRGDMFYVRNYVRVNGSEQTAERPALVVSNDIGNENCDMCEVVYLTTKEKKPLPTHVEVMCKVPSTALCEQVYSVSQERLGEYIRTATEDEMKEINRALIISLGLNDADIDCSEDCIMIGDLKMKLEGAERKLDEVKEQIERKQLELEDKDRNLEELRGHLGKMIEKKREAEIKLEKAPNHEEFIGLKAKVEILEKQNEKLLDRLIG